MKKSISRRNRTSHGGTLAIALIMTMLGGLFMAGWVSLMSARSAQARGIEYAAKRRLSLENSRALARQYGYTEWLRTTSTVNPNLTTTMTGQWGALDTYSGINNSQPFGMPLVTSYPETGYYNTVFPFNHSGFRPGPSFVSLNRTVRPSSSANHLDPFSIYLFGKSAPPSFAGDCFVVYRKPATRAGEINLSSNLYIDGRLVIRDPRSFNPSTTVDSRVPQRILTRCKSLHVQKRDDLNPLSGTTLTGLAAIPSNLPAVSSTNGYANVADTTAAYEGDLNVVENANHPANSLFHIQQREVDAGATLLSIVSPLDYGDAASPVQVIQYTDADLTAIPPVVPPANVQTPGYQLNDWSIAYIRTGHPDLPHIRISPVIDQVVFQGQTTSTAHAAAAALDPRIIVIISDPTQPTALLDTIVFTHENARPMILGVKGLPSYATEVGYYFVGPSVSGVSRSQTNLLAETTTDIGWSINLIIEARTTRLFRETPMGSAIANRVNISGGIQTNWSFERDPSDTGAHNTMRISPPIQSYKLARLLPREAWLETYIKFEP